MEIKYDLAISLLDQDVSIGWEIVNKLGNSEKIFFYPKDVDELTFNNGLNVFGDVFSKKARFILVLYREKYGTTKWTAIENSIIQDRFLKTINSYNSPILFCRLDNSAKPNWLPETYIYGSIEDVDNLVRVLQKKITDFGGISFPQTAEERLRITVRKKRYDESFKEIIFNSLELAEKSRKEASILKDSILFKLEHNATVSDLFYKDLTQMINSNISKAHFNVLFGNLSISLKDNQHATNSIQNAYLEIRVSENGNVINIFQKKFYITMEEIIGWRNLDETGFLSTEQFTECIFQEIVSIYSGEQKRI